MYRPLGMAVWKGARWYVRRRYLPARESRWRRRAWVVGIVAVLAVLVFARSRHRTPQDTAPDAPGADARRPRPTPAS